MKDHMNNCALCNFFNVDGQIDPSLVFVFTKLHCMLSRHPQGLSLCCFVIGVLKFWHMGCFVLSLEEILVKN
jgi:hypothetical protein